MPELASPNDSRVCVILPTYNNAETLEAVLRSVLEHGLPMIVVNDGATDDTPVILEQFENVEVIRHSTNLGKGAALKTGLDAAVRRGFTHAIAMDTDGQHVPADLPRLVVAIRENPDALIVGVRDLKGGGARLKSRLLRTNSNFWSWIETGVRTCDSQSGFRAYPLQAIQALRLRSRRYDFEIEVLVKALWSGVPLRTLPIAVRYGMGSRSHFRPFRDFARVSWLNCQLVAWRLLIPAPMRRMLAGREFDEQTRTGRWRWFVRHYLTTHNDRPSRIGLAVGVGVCFGILPIWGIQMLTALVVAERLRLNRALVLAASNISFGAMAAVIVLASTLVGRAILSSDSPLPSDHAADATGLGTWAIEYLLGSVVLAVVAGVVLGGLAFLVGSAVRRGSTSTVEEGSP